MKRRTFVTGVTGGIALTAGCTGTLGGSNDPERGTVRFYVSDEPNRIDDFERLDVTISTVALKPVGEDDEDDPESDDDDNDSTDETESAGESDSTGDTESTTDEAGESDGEGDDGNVESDDEDNESDDESGGDSPEDGRGGWDEYDLDDPTVDLTRLKGPKATVLDELDVPAGEYVAVDMFVADIHAVLTDGTETELKIPSERLKIRTPFTVAADEELDFVYDIAPKKAGESGKYILTPVIGESGTDAEIEEVDARSAAGE